MLILFWKALLIISIIWYIFTIITVAIKGLEDIKNMLKAVSSENNTLEEKSEK